MRKKTSFRRQCWKCLLQVMHHSYAANGSDKQIFVCISTIDKMCVKYIDLNFDYYNKFNLKRFINFVSLPTSLFLWHQSDTSVICRIAQSYTLAYKTNTIECKKNRRDHEYACSQMVWPIYRICCARCTNRSILGNVYQRLSTYSPYFLRIIAHTFEKYLETYQISIVVFVSFYVNGNFLFSSFTW